MTAPDGKPLEGVAVSARASDKTFTTTVYTNEHGEYFFPPLEEGQYKVWAQAVAFAAARVELKVSPGEKMQQDFTLRSREDFEKQLSGTEWMASLPADTPDDRRMKALFLHNCTSCHVASFILQNRFDAAGWGSILNLMSRIGVYAFTKEDPQHPANPSIRAFKEELVSYLVRVRGPNSPALKFKPLPRPTGEAAQVIVTEYDISPGDRPGYISSYDGSDWSQGTPSTHEGRAIHDVMVDIQGNVWFGNTIPLGRTIGRLDPRTGQITEYTFPEKNNKPVNARGLVQDRGGNIWFTDNSRDAEEGGMVKFNPRTEKFQLFPRPRTIVSRMGAFLALDSKGNLWYDNPDGAVKWDPKAEESTRYKTAAPTGEKPYECTVDAKDNVWCAMMNSNRLVVIESQTGQVSVLPLALLKDEVTEKDRTMRARIASSEATSFVLQKGPRRLDADKRGDTVWVALFWAGRLARIDINTRKATEYRLPNPNSTPYKVAVDKNHMVWIDLMNSDRIAKFNPFTEQFTEFPLPTLGTEARHIAIDDNNTDPPTVWVPYYRVNKIARLQFRTGPAVQGR